MKLNLSVFRTMILSAFLLMGMALQARVVSGVVKDQTGETIISASVVVKGTSIGTVTDFDGNYSLEVPEDAKVLVFSYIGMQTHNKEVGSDLELCLELASITIFNADTAVEFTFESIINLRSHLQKSIFQLAKYREGIVEHTLFKR